MPTSSRFFRRALSLVLLAAAPLAAESSTQEVTISTTVHGHAFDRVKVEPTGCSVRVRLFFDAPKEVYSSKEPARNHYNFRARLRLAEGRVVTSPVFASRVPGRRVYEFTHDTSAQECWATKSPALQAIDIEGCRGQRCRPDPFR